MDLELRVNREILRAAVGRAMFCTLTDVVLDAKTAVLLEVKRGPILIASSVYDSKAWDSNGQGILDVLARRGGLTTEVTDGRKLWVKRTRKATA